MRHKFGSEIDLDGLETVDRDELEAWLVERVEALYKQVRADHYGSEDWDKIQQFILLETMDNKWKDHLYAMEVLKHGIGLRGYAQMNPKDEFKKEGYEKFEMLKHAIADQVTDLLFKVELQEAPDARAMHQPMAPPPMPDDPATQRAIMEAMVAAGQAPAGDHGGGRPRRADRDPGSRRSRSPGPSRRERQQQAAAQTITGGKKPKRNDPCPCGSGIKYKKCCHPAFD